MPFPVSYDINYYQGDTYELLLQPKDSSGTAMNLTGYAGLFTVSTARGDSGIVVANGIITINSGSNIFCTLAASAGNNLLASSYVYDIQLSSGSTVYTLLTGNVNVTQNIKEAVVS
jgi:hypothetical protein